MEGSRSCGSFSTVSDSVGVSVEMEVIGSQSSPGQAS